MTTLWYSDEEVRDYHPIVERTLNNAIANNNLTDVLEVIHHSPGIKGISIIPDFAVKVKATGKFIFILEVKRKKQEVFSQRYGNQARSYVNDFSQFWQNNFNKYFCLTNIEELILFADRAGGSLNSCILANNPYSHGSFDPVTHDATSVIQNFETSLTTIIDQVFKNTQPAWNNDWIEIVNSFETNFKAIINDLNNYDPDEARDVTLYELLRLLIYSFLKEFYILNSNQNKSFFRALSANNNKVLFESSLRTIFNKVLSLDFLQIFRNHPDTTKRIFTENLNNTILGHFNNFIDSLNRYINNALKNNQSPPYFFSLLTSKIYEKQELHNKGKIMSDSELSSLLANLCVDEGMETILDPGCGDGALLDAAYDTLQFKAMVSGNPLTHNQLLNSLYGLDIDPFLTQLATFRLLAKNIIQVDSQTNAQIEVGDIFDNPKNSFFDCILMNPPFLRNDDPKAPISANKKTKMITAIKNQHLDCFVEKASQPNLYFYFANYIWHYLKDGGKAGIILMAKFLNNKDAIFLREFFLNKVESVILYPKGYFTGFTITTAIVTLKKGRTINNYVSFLRVINPVLLSEPQKIIDILKNTSDDFQADYNLKIVPRNELTAESNWKSFLGVPLNKFNDLDNLELFQPMKLFFEKVQRGSAETNGGSTTIFLKEKSNQLLEHANNVENNFIGYGLKNSDAKRKFILTSDCLNQEMALHAPDKFYDQNNSGLNPSTYQNSPGLINYYSEASKTHTGKWKNILNAAYRNKIQPDIILPRAKRVTHEAFYNANKETIVISTNFFYLEGLQNHHPSLPKDIQLQFFTAFLLSCFGQIQFEIHSNNHEGLRKLEGYGLDNFKLPDIKLIPVKNIKKIAQEFVNLNNSDDTVFTGDEGASTPRRQLDLAIGEIIFNYNNLGFATAKELVNDFELFLAELVEDRRL
jgi:methylase of polypeptide subunit release factors